MTPSTHLARCYFDAAGALRADTLARRRGAAVDSMATHSTYASVHTPLDRRRMPVFHMPDLGGYMRAFRLTLRALLVVLRFALNVTVAVARTVTVCLLWLVAPQACLAVPVLRPRKR